jgi:O-6-methylguanine DNA methyltransferase
MRVWEELQRIPYGETRSYQQVAVAAGAQHAVRAVGAANGANPVPIVVPCHRVIGSNGKLTGYGGGLPLKKRLLELEGALTMSL